MADEPVSYSGGTGHDVFVANILDGKRDGYYVELGAWDYKQGNNTYMLEQDFGWKGVSFDVLPDYVEKWNQNRKNPCLFQDARTFNYVNYFEENNFPKQIDYLQVDMDAGYDNEGNEVGGKLTSLQGLIALPLSSYRFTVIHFEHDYLNDYRNAEERDAQRTILSSYGYKLVQRHMHEDWWVDPKVIPYQKFKEHFVMMAP